MNKKFLWIAIALFVFSLLALIHHTFLYSAFVENYCGFSGGDCSGGGMFQTCTDNLGGYSCSGNSILLNIYFIFSFFVYLLSILVLYRGRFKVDENGVLIKYPFKKFLILLLIPFFVFLAFVLYFINAIYNGYSIFLL